MRVKHSILLTMRKSVDLTRHINRTQSFFKIIFGMRSIRKTKLEQMLEI